MYISNAGVAGILLYYVYEFHKEAEIKFVVNFVLKIHDITKATFLSNYVLKYAILNVLIKDQYTYVKMHVLTKFLNSGNYKRVFFFVVNFY